LHPSHFPKIFSFNKTKRAINKVSAEYFPETQEVMDEKILKKIEQKMMHKQAIK